MPLEQVVFSIGTVISVIGGTWYLSRQLSTLSVENTNTKEDVKELKSTVNDLSSEVAEIKGFLQPERVSVVPPARKRPRPR